MSTYVTQSGSVQHLKHNQRTQRRASKQNLRPQKYLHTNNSALKNNTIFLELKIKGPHPSLDNPDKPVKVSNLSVYKFMYKHKLMRLTILK